MRNRTSSTRPNLYGMGMAILSQSIDMGKPAAQEPEPAAPTSPAVLPFCFGRGKKKTQHEEEGRKYCSTCWTFRNGGRMIPVGGRS